MSELEFNVPFQVEVEYFARCWLGNRYGVLPVKTHCNNNLQ